MHSNTENSSPRALSDSQSELLALLKNPQKIGEKNGFDGHKNGSEYDSVHLKFQQQGRKFVDKNGYYDLFFIDKQGTVVYTYFKETDYASNLKHGGYANSGFGKLWQKVASIPDSDKEHVVQFLRALHSQSKQLISGELKLLILRTTQTNW